MNRRFAALVLLIGAVGLGIFSWRQFQKVSKAQVAAAHPLTVFCAAGLRQPVGEIAARYQREEGVPVQIQFGGSGSLLSALRVAKKGDLFIAADETTVAEARKSDSVREVLPVAIQRPVIAVRAGNPKNIRSLADLLREDVKLALANPEAASISRVTRDALGTGWEPLAARAAVMKPTVSEIAADLQLGAVDAAIVWDSLISQFKLAAIEAPEISARRENASACIVSDSEQPAAALRFARYLSAPEKGAVVFKASGFAPAGGDQWADRPELILYSGGVNRPAVEGLLHQFGEREGATITTVFNGCGILCASMKTMGDASNPKFPDAYYACDLCFVPPVAHIFPEAVVLTETEIGMIVRKGNPRGVKTMADLAQADLKVGLCNAEQSTLGYMTRGMLKSSGLHDSVRKNVVVETPTADLLVNQMRAGALDAAIVYRVNFQPSSEHLDYIALQHPGAKAVQPFSVRATSPNARLGARLLDFLKRNRSQFENAGFRWRGDEPPLKSAEIEVPPWLKE